MSGVRDGGGAMTSSKPNEIKQHLKKNCVIESKYERLSEKAIM